MNHAYPQETKGTTLYEDKCANEYRRVYLYIDKGMLEVGELTYGLLTYDVYGTNAHFHCVHVDENAFGRGMAFMRQLVGGDESACLEALLSPYFAAGRYLADFMDDLDDWGVSYGYLNMVDNGGVTYRSSQASARRYPHLRFVDP